MAYFNKRTRQKQIVSWKSFINIDTLKMELPLGQRANILLGLMRSYVEQSTLICYLSKQNRTDDLLRYGILSTRGFSVERKSNDDDH